MDKMTRTQMGNLKSNGWAFMPRGPDEWGWLKFSEMTGRVIAEAGEPVFFDDMERHNEKGTSDTGQAECNTTESKT